MFGKINLKVPLFPFVQISLFVLKQIWALCQTWMLIRNSPPNTGHIFGHGVSRLLFLIL